MSKKRFVSALVVFLPLMLYSRDAYAYVDPGTVGYLFQLILLAFFAGVAALAFFRGKVEAAIGTIFTLIKKLLGGSSS